MTSLSLPAWRTVAISGMVASLLTGCQVFSPLAALFNGGRGGLAEPVPPAGAPAPAGTTPGTGGGTSSGGGTFPVNFEPDEDTAVRLPVPIAALYLQALGGTGEAGFAGDGDAADRARFASPAGISWGRAGLVVADTANHRLRRIEFDGTVMTMAGTGTAGEDGDGPDATRQALSSPTRVAIDSLGNVFFSDTGNRLVRCVDPRGRLFTVAGGGTSPPGEAADIATDVALQEPLGLAFAPDGALYIADAGAGRVLRFGDNGKLRALPASFARPVDVAVSAAGTLAVADAQAREVVTVAPDGGKARVVGPDWLESAAGIAYGEAGDMLIADTAAGRIWLAGLDGGVSSVVISGASGICSGPRGQFFLADPSAHRLAALTPEP
ncbi:MAG: hypothetical protein FJZ01_19185 [Candidatus Sericytochromatia bacterium]|nr:hypothetical protein [Candidatus Tanganyikabacteria bacterium]